MQLCGEMRGGRRDDCLDGKGAHREPAAKNTKTLTVIFSFLCEINIKFTFSYNSCEADGDHLLLYEAVPVLLYEIPGKQVASEAVTHSADDQRQLLSLDAVAPQTFL